MKFELTKRGTNIVIDTVGVRYAIVFRTDSKSLYRWTLINDAAGFDLDINGRVQEERKFKYVIKENSIALEGPDGEWISRPFLVSIMNRSNKFIITDSVNDSLGLELNEDQEIQEEK